MGLTDMAMVSRLGAVALAATGMGSLLLWVIMSMGIGLRTAVQTVTSRRLGQKKYDECGLPLNAGILIVVGYSLICGVIMGLTAPFILGLFSSDSHVVQLAEDYYMWRLPGVLAIGIAFCFRGFWNGIKEPNTYTFILVATHILNILLNFILKFLSLAFNRLIPPLLTTFLAFIS